MRPLILAALALSGCMDSIVSAECADGYDLCGTVCVPQGTCTEPSGGTPDAAMPGPDGGPGADAPRADAGPGSDASTCEGGGVYCPASGTCVQIGTDDENCGFCGNVCDTGLTCSAGVCCGAGELGCRGVCILPMSDPDNCGMCGVVCTSGICEDGECVGDPSGHLVVIGHDYVKSRVGMNRLVGNAVFMARSAQVKVLVYGGDATNASRIGTDRAIAQVAQEIGRSVQYVASDDANVPAHLPTTDVFLVYAQSLASAGSLDDLADDWSAALSQFLARGGIAIVLEGTGAETRRVVGALFSATGRVDVTGMVLTVSSPADAVATDVPDSYWGEVSSVAFTGASAPSVVVSTGGDAVVVHRVF